MIQLVVRFHREFSVTYNGKIFQSPSAKSIEHVNELLIAFPDAQIKPPPGGTTDNSGGSEGIYYMIYVDNLGRAEDLRNKLISQPVVDAAYIKPPAALPDSSI